MATHRNLFPNSGWMKRTICVIAGIAFFGLLTGVIIGVASLLFANQFG
jgi:hypothetical protein